MRHPRVWAWKCRFGLCHWAEPYRSNLSDDDKPSSEATAVCVRIVPTSDYRKIMAAAKKGGYTP